jgi:hypothetical protein
MIERAAGPSGSAVPRSILEMPLILFAAERDHAHGAVEVALFRSSAVEGDLHGVTILLIFIAIEGSYWRDLFANSPAVTL